MKRKDRIEDTEALLKIANNEPVLKGVIIGIPLSVAGFFVGFIF